MPMALSGLRISCATPEASSPSAKLRSRRACSASSADTSRRACSQAACAVARRRLASSSARAGPQRRQQQEGMDDQAARDLALARAAPSVRSMPTRSRLTGRPVDLQARHGFKGRLAVEDDLARGRLARAQHARQQRVVGNRGQAARRWPSQPGCPARPGAPGTRSRPAARSPAAAGPGRCDAGRRPVPARRARRRRGRRRAAAGRRPGDSRPRRDPGRAAPQPGPGPGRPRRWSRARSSRKPLHAARPVCVPRRAPAGRLRVRSGRPGRWRRPGCRSSPATAGPSRPRRSPVKPWPAGAGRPASPRPRRRPARGPGSHRPHGAPAPRSPPSANPLRHARHGSRAPSRPRRRRRPAPAPSPRWARAAARFVFPPDGS